MKAEQIIQQLEANGPVFKSLFENKTEEQYRWKPEEKSWSLLEIICHLYDEEREDFRTRTFNALLTPGKRPSSIDPQGWVRSRAYADQDCVEKVNGFLNERTNSILLLRSIIDPKWNNVYIHPSIGPISAYSFLSNWLAHDYHHIRQINRRLYEFLRHTSNEGLGYAGDW